MGLEQTCKKALFVSSQGETRVPTWRSMHLCCWPICYEISSILTRSTEQGHGYQNGRFSSFQTEIRNEIRTWHNYLMIPGGGFRKLCRRFYHTLTAHYYVHHNCDRHLYFHKHSDRKFALQNLQAQCAYRQHC